MGRGNRSYYGIDSVVSAHLSRRSDTAMEIAQAASHSGANSRNGAAVSNDSIHKTYSISCIFHTKVT